MRRERDRVGADPRVRPGAGGKPAPSPDRVRRTAVERGRANDPERLRRAMQKVLRRFRQRRARS